MRAAWMRFRRAVSRSEWAVRLLGLPRTPDGALAPGLVLVQIDGLSRAELEKALARGRMPHLRKRIRRRGAVLHSLYSGLPSTTSAMQAELFYGVRTAVPAVQFRDPETEEITAMLAPGPTARRQARIETLRTETGRKSLLEDGSAFADVFTGGAENCTFCFANLGLSSVLKAARPSALLAVFFLHGFVIVRMAALALLETFLAVVDVVRGVAARRSLVMELLFVPNRVAVVILLRELAALAARIDIARGSPVIHVNFPGYDEQAHRRGPDSSFAHWTLKGIDRAIRSLHRAASRSAHRDYDVWVHADHGQEKVLPYERLTAEPLETAVARLLDERDVRGAGTVLALDRLHLKRVLLLGGRLLQKIFGQAKAGNRLLPLKVADHGPVAHVYLPDALDEETARATARDLVERAAVPAVLAAADDGTVRAWTHAGEHVLPRDARAVVGEDHPFLEAVGEDLATLVRHPDAGDFVLLGWKPRGTPLSFAFENGAHGGPGRRETHAFALLSPDAPLAPPDAAFLRPEDLREAALRRMQREEGLSEPLPTPAGTLLKPLRVMTYNIHRCKGMDGKFHPDRVARVIARHAPDLVALQELDCRARGSGSVDQAREIALCLTMDHHFHPSLESEPGGKYGNALLAREPLRLVRADALPRLGRAQKRGILWVEMPWEGKRLQILNTHLGLRPRERRVQAKAIRETWLEPARREGPVVLCGDFNTRPGSAVHRRFSDAFRDAFSVHPDRGFERTFMGWTRLDYVFVSDEFRVIHAIVPRDELARLTSDHFPLVVDLALPVPEKEGR